MWLALILILSGCYLLFIAAKYHPMIGYRGVLYLLNIKDSWKVTNQVFGCLLILSGIFYSVYYLLNGPNTRIFIVLLLIIIVITDYIAWIIIKKKQ
ncbi:MAG: hypothetical protein RR554_08555 [Vagococcus sp.]|uniref:hypothetical protein n=1 Tax=Vagococcus sp. TaxID=1933889 RepID=UPI002FC6313A